MFRVENAYKPFGGIRMILILLRSDSGQVVSGSTDHTLKVWNIQSVNAPTPLPGGGQVVSGSMDKTFKVWNGQSGQCLKTLQGHTDTIQAVAALRSGLVVSESEDNTLNAFSLWHMHTVLLQCCKVGRWSADQRIT